jgi:hypothetical protein
MDYIVIIPIYVPQTQKTPEKSTKTDKKTNPNRLKKPPVGVKGTQNQTSYRLKQSKI